MDASNPKQLFAKLKEGTLSKEEQLELMKRLNGDIQSFRQEIQESH